MTQILKIDGLCKSFGGLNAICDFDFELAEGEILDLIGPNGSGKATAL
jgi:branched-chain amino acid transport system ATP-binding protein